MKKYLIKLRSKLKKLWQWLRKNVFNKEMIFWVAVAETIFWSPCVVTGALAVFVNKWWWTAFTGIIIFWSGPFTPAVPLQIALALVLKRMFAKSENKVYNKVLKALKRNKRICK